MSATLVADMNAAFNFDKYRDARTALCRYQNEQQTFAYFWVSTRYGIACAARDRARHRRL